jgi:peptidyl-prolyl cis-trans isomerase C
MKKGIICLMLFLAAGWLITGCGEKETESPAPVADSRSVELGTMVAKVNGKEITGAMLNQQLNLMMQQYAQQVPPDQMSKLQPMLRQQAVTALVNQELLREAAEEAGITLEAKAIDDEIEKIAGQFPTREQFEAQMTQAGVTEEDLRKDIARGLKIQALVKKEAPSEEEATDEEIEAFYTGNAEQFQHPEQVEASHILIKFDPADTDQQKEEKRNKLAELKKQIDEGADFAELAKANSQDVGSGEKGGELGYFGRGRMIKPFEEVAFSLAPGEVGEIVETRFGYHLIKVTGRKDARVVPLEEVKEQVGIYLVNQKKQQAVGDYLQKLRSAAMIEYGQGFKPIPPPPIGEFPPPAPPK